MRLEALVASLRPAVVAVAGVTAYRTAFGRPGAALGRQPELLAGAELWVVPNPSGLNAHETDRLAGGVVPEGGGGSRRGERRRNPSPAVGSFDGRGGDPEGGEYRGWGHAHLAHGGSRPDVLG